MTNNSSPFLQLELCACFGDSMQGHRLRIRCGLRRENFSETLATLTENFPPETLHYTPQPAVTTLPETEKEWQQTPDEAV
ncbi:hypothetical protein [Mycolicibacterium conceptionense]|uniref:hypothetical protein n=1 Tax=Mycolicibacterium conceptionense TaxID=451644 RepID=UPI00105585D6|nr:hypothetical protein [Mycolicibacterium conceptionense]